ncbi:RNA polymerase sigma factor [Microbacteriaceae bacterium K1510]|nr:RNA polymerase sigma factor [Microbacteriaceae bacterium K1510]
MTETTRSALINVLVTSYDDFKRLLTHRLGSAELAGEALQDTFLRLESATAMGPVRKPRAYLLRTAFNLALNRVVAEKRRVTLAEVDAMLEIADDAPDPARIVEARSDVVVIQRALRELSPRRREIVIAACLDDVSLKVLAKRFGVSLRTIQIELKQTLIHLAGLLEHSPARDARHRARRNAFVGSAPGKQAVQELPKAHIAD